jgi:hypothetical protein
VPKKKKEEKGVLVRIIGPNCWIADRHYWPGETATVPAEYAETWINDRRAVDVAAEVKDDRSDVS